MLMLDMWISEMKYLLYYGRKNYEFTGMTRWMNYDGNVNVVLDNYNIGAILEIIEANNIFIDFQILNYSVMFNNCNIDFIKTNFDSISVQIADILAQMICVKDDKCSYKFKTGLGWSFCNMFMDQPYIKLENNPEKFDENKAIILGELKGAYGCYLNDEPSNVFEKFCRAWIVVMTYEMHIFSHDGREYVNLPFLKFQ
jgi:hypothetical protein